MSVLDLRQRATTVARRLLTSDRGRLVRGVARRFQDAVYGPPDDAALGDPRFYAEFVRLNPPRSSAVLTAALRERFGDSPPLVSVITPVYNVPARFLTECIESVRSQVYPRWEHVLVDDASTASHVRPLLERAASDDSRDRVHFRDVNGGIGAAMRTALDHASGEWVAILDNDDELTPDALAEMMLAIADAPSCVWAYSDFVLKRETGELSHPFFKPDYSPERLMRQMYLNHLQIFRRDAALTAGGFRPGFDGSQDFDLALRLMELPAEPLHVRKVLYHWRISATSTTSQFDAKPDAQRGGRLALESALERRGLSHLQVHDEPGYGSFFVDYEVGTGGTLEANVLPSAPRVSVLVLPRGPAAHLVRCLASIGRGTTTPHELFVLDQPKKGSENDGAAWNQGVSRASGDVVVLMHGDVVVESADWLERMLVHVQKAGVGAVGPLTVYTSGLIRDAGLALDPDAGAVAVGHRVDGHARGPFGLLAAERNVSAVSATCLMVRKAVFEEVNGFGASGFERALADVDLCLRLRARGYRHVFTPRARCVYQGSPLPRILRRPDPRALAALKSRWHHELERDPYTFMSPLKPKKT